VHQIERKKLKVLSPLDKNRNINIKNVKDQEKEHRRTFHINLQSSSQKELKKVTSSKTVRQRPQRTQLKE